MILSVSTKRKITKIKNDIGNKDKEKEETLFEGARCSNIIADIDFNF